GRWLGAAARDRRPRGRPPGRRRGPGPAEEDRAAVLLAPGRVRRRHLRSCGCPARLLPARPDAGRRAAERGHRRLRRPAAPPGGREDAPLARPMAPLGQGLRGVAREVSGAMVTVAMTRL